MPTTGWNTLKTLLKPTIFFSSTKSSTACSLRGCSMTQRKAHRDKWEIFFKMCPQSALKHWSRFTRYCIQGITGKKIKPTCVADQLSLCGLFYTEEVRLSKPPNKHAAHTQKGSILLAALHHLSKHQPLYWHLLRE